MTEEADPATSGRLLATVMFVDIIGSTERAAELGDRHWRDIVVRYWGLVREELSRFGGHEIDTAGDGFFAYFEGPTDAVRCAAAISYSVERLGLAVRIGLHTGECELIGEKLGGIAVHVGARVAGEAGPGEILVSSTVKDILGGSGLRFEDRGVRALSGVRGEWRLFAVDRRLVGEPDYAKPIRVLLADDQALVRAGFRKILEADSQIEVVAEAADGLEAVEAARRLFPDLVLMDIRMPNLDGLEATRRLLDGGSQVPRVLILTTFGLNEYVYEALRAGASGFLLKDAPPEELLAAVHVVSRGDALLDPSITRAVIKEFARRHVRVDLAAKLDELTPREREVLDLLARGLSNAQIAERFVVSEGTVKTHVASILHKLGVRDRVQAVIYAYESGLVEPGVA